MLSRHVLSQVQVQLQFLSFALSLYQLLFVDAESLDRSVYVDNFLTF
jgi:hypothetical protein